MRKYSQKNVIFKLEKVRTREEACLMAMVTKRHAYDIGG